MQFKKTSDRTIKLLTKTGRTPEVIAHVEEIMEETPKTSIRQLRQQINVPVNSQNMRIWSHENPHEFSHCSLKKLV